MSPDEILRHAKSVIGDDSDGVPVLKKAIDIIIMQREQLFNQQKGVNVDYEELNKRYWNLVGDSASDACDVYVNVILIINDFKRAIDALIDDKNAKRAVMFYMDEIINKLKAIFPDTDGDYLRSVGMYHKIPPNVEFAGGRQAVQHNERLDSKPSTEE